QYLSGKLSHLSATHQESESTTRAADVLSRIKTDNVVISSQLIPKYLSHESKEFDRMILGLRQQTGTVIYTEELRAIAFLIDQLQRIKLEKYLYTTYLRSGQDYKIILYQIPIEKEIIRIEYDFFDRLSELEFYSENSNAYQKQLFQYLTQKKFDMEKSKLELALLKQRITHNHLPTSFDKLEISIPTPIHTIMDTETAQSLKEGEITDSGEDVEQDIDRCDDIFHEYGDDIDEDEDKNIEFDNLQRTIIEKKDESNENDHTKSIIPNDKLHDNDSSGIFLDFTVDKDELCQKPSQLAASSKIILFMAEERKQNSTFDEIDKLLDDEEFCRAVEALNDDADITVHSSTQTTPDPLNTAFIEETNLNEHQQSNLSQQQSSLSQQQSNLSEQQSSLSEQQKSLPQQQSQTINDASAILRELAEITTEHEHERIDQPLPTTTAAGNLVEIVDLSPSTSRTIDLRTPSPTTIDLSTPAPITIDLDSPQIPSNTNTTDSPLHLSPK
ncbi:unnamed protein product, partial [Rotaria sordida]